MHSFGIIMTHCNMTVDAVQFPGLPLVIEVRLASLFGQTQRVVVLVTVNTGCFKGMPGGKIDL